MHRQTAIAAAFTALAAFTGRPAAAEVRSLTLGITMNCPYGLGG